MKAVLLVTGLLMIAAALGIWLRPLRFVDGFSYLRLWLSGGQSRSVAVNGHRIHYNVVGALSGTTNAPVVVLVHGLGGRAEDWQNLSPFLVRAGYRVYMLDLPGFGRSEQPAAFSYSIPDQDAAVKGFLDALGLTQVDLAGWSMGGWIVQLVATQHPENIRRLILFDSAGLGQAPAWDTQLFTPRTIGELHQFLAVLMPHPPYLPDFIGRDLVRIAQKNAWVIHRALASMLTGHDTTDALLPQLNMPVLIVWGSEDQIFPLSHGELMHHLVPQSQLEIIPGCGHLLVIQCASQIGPRVLDFLNR